MELDIAITGYADIRKRLQSAWSSPVQLSDIGLKLGTYGTYIADHLGDMKAQYEQDRAVKYLNYLKEGKSSSQAENLARSELAELKGQIAKIELVHKNLWSLATMIQSRLGILKNETFMGSTT
jgi:hypothetical protein